MHGPRVVRTSSGLPDPPGSFVFFLQYESSVEGLWSRSSDHHTRVSISSWRARAVRTAGPAVPQPLPPYQPTHPRGNGPSVLARLYVTVWSTATPYHPK
jgi:hypothetical protein